VTVPEAPRVPSDVSRLRLLRRMAALRLSGAANPRRVWARRYPPPTLTWFDARKHPGVRGHVALSVDDAFWSGVAPGVPMLDEVRGLLGRHGARATFFVMLDGCADVEHASVRRLLDDGHELANHCASDRPYHEASASEFGDALLATQRRLVELQGHEPRWFRAPHGRLSDTMLRTLEKHDLTHVMMDCYAEDPFVPDSRFVGRFLARHAQHGSIVLLHMPERGFREWNFEALDVLLTRLAKKGLRAVTVTELSQLAATP